MINESVTNRIQEMTKIMLHYSNGGEVFSKPSHCSDEEFELDLNPIWNWSRYEYKMAPRKKVIYAVFREDELVRGSTNKDLVNQYAMNHNLPITIFKEL